MSNKKKHAQAARRQVRVAVGEYEKSLFAKIERIRLAFKPKPKLIPFFVWHWLTALVIDLGEVKKGDTNGNEITKKGEDTKEQPQDGRAGQEHQDDSADTNK